MKTATLPSLRVAPELRQAAEAVLEKLGKRLAQARKATPKAVRTARKK